MDAKQGEHEHHEESNQIQEHSFDCEGYLEGRGLQRLLQRSSDEDGDPVSLIGNRLGHLPLGQGTHGEATILIVPFYNHSILFHV